MTPLPPACVLALRAAIDAPLQRSDECDCPDIIPSCDACCSRIAHAVLDAFVAGEAKGLWKVEERPPEGLFRPVMRWRVARTDGSHWIDGFLHKAQAIGCAAVLNYLEAKGE